MHAGVQLFGGWDSDPILLGGFQNEVSGVAWHPHELTNLATCCDDGVLHVWRAASRPQEGATQVPHCCSLW